MNAKEIEKKRRELGEGETAAAYLNQEAGTDYKVVPSDREPADVLFVSVGGQHPERMVQVVACTPAAGQSSLQVPWTGYELLGAIPGSTESQEMSWIALACVIVACADFYWRMASMHRVNICGL